MFWEDYPQILTLALDGLSAPDGCQKNRISVPAGLPNAGLEYLMVEYERFRPWFHPKYDHFLLKLSQFHALKPAEDNHQVH